MKDKINAKAEICKKTTTPKDSSNTRPFAADENISKVCSKINSATKELISR